MAGENESFKQITRNRFASAEDGAGTEEASSDELRQAYLDLLKKSLSGMLNEGGGTHWAPRGWRKLALGLVLPRDVCTQRTTQWQQREEGRDWPSGAQTMIGLKRLNNLQTCLETVIRDGIPGDVIAEVAGQVGDLAYTSFLRTASHTRSTVRLRTQ